MNQPHISIVRSLALACGLMAVSLGDYRANAAPAALSTVATPADRWGYADLADVFAEAPVIALVRVAEAIALAESSANSTAALRAGTIRYYLGGSVQTLIRGPAAGLAPRIAWLADLPRAPDGRAPRSRRMVFVIGATTVAAHPSEVRLVARDAMVAATPALIERVRQITQAASVPEVATRVTGVTSAFHVPGNLPGESETQIFLDTLDRRPVSLSVLRRPNVAPKLSVALGEFVDDTAPVPLVDTLAWYRIACFVPPDLPTSATASLSPETAAAARIDYATALDLLGRCVRRR